jgi:hypothetical protein
MQAFMRNAATVGGCLQDIHILLVLAIYRKTENYFLLIARKEYSDLLSVSLASLQEEHREIMLYICCSSKKTKFIIIII